MKNKEEADIQIYCIDCKIFFSLEEASLEGVWYQCPQCKGQNYTIRKGFK